MLSIVRDRWPRNRVSLDHLCHPNPETGFLQITFATNQQLL
ncbi:hypothetical protein [Planktothricoides sp. SR001]|nr:hypothetical protein [Planktothricoides sp. SR001]